MHIALIHSPYQNLEAAVTETNPYGPSIVGNTINSIQTALEANGHRVSLLEAGNHLLSILEQMDTPDLLFNMSSGISDKRSQANIIGMLEMTNIPMLASGLAANVLGLHKEVTKSLLLRHGIRTARYQLVTDENDELHEDFEYPLIVKPEHEGSGIGVTDSSKVDSPDQIQKVIKKKLALHKQVLLVEEYLPGREFTVGVMGNATLEIMPIKETKFKKNGPQILTNEMKVNATSLSEIPAKISESLEYEIKWMAKKTYRILRCEDFARIDFRLDEEGRPHVIELNTFPGLEKGYSFFPLIAEAAGYSYEELLNRLVEIAMEPRGVQ